MHAQQACNVLLICSLGFMSMECVARTSRWLLLGGCAWMRAARHQGPVALHVSAQPAWQQLAVDEEQQALRQSLNHQHLHTRLETFGIQQVWPASMKAIVLHRSQGIGLSPAIQHAFNFGTAKRTLPEMERDNFKTSKLARPYDAGRYCLCK